MIETVLTCPLGHKCEEIKDGKIHKCAWFTTLAGRNPQTGEQLDEKGCAIAWLPLMQVEVAQSNRGTAEAVISLREETIKRQDAALSMQLQANQPPRMRLVDDGFGSCHGELV